MDWDKTKQTLATKEVRTTGTVGITPVVTITPGKGFEAVRVVNTNSSASKTVSISPDGGSTWFDTPANSERMFGAMDLLSIKGSEAAVVYDIEYLKRQ